MTRRDMVKVGLASGAIAGTPIEAQATTDQNFINMVIASHEKNILHGFLGMVASHPAFGKTTYPASVHAGATKAARTSLQHFYHFFSQLDRASGGSYTAAAVELSRYHTPYNGLFVADRLMPAVAPPPQSKKLRNSYSKLQLRLANLKIPTSDLRGMRKPDIYRTWGWTIAHLHIVHKLSLIHSGVKIQAEDTNFKPVFFQNCGNYSGLRNNAEQSIGLGITLVNRAAQAAEWIGTEAFWSAAGWAGIVGGAAAYFVGGWLNQCPQGYNIYPSTMMNLPPVFGPTTPIPPAPYGTPDQNSYVEQYIEPDYYGYSGGYSYGGGYGPDDEYATYMDAL